MYKKNIISKKKYSLVVLLFVVQQTYGLYQKPTELSSKVEEPIQIITEKLQALKCFGGKDFEIYTNGQITIMEDKRTGQAIYNGTRSTKLGGVEQLQPEEAKILFLQLKQEEAESNSK